MAFENVLYEVKTNPENAFSQMGFITEIEEGNYAQGGQRQVKITCLDERKQIYLWQVKNGSGEIYYFPYLNSSTDASGKSTKSIGYVLVPKRTPDGTIVVTGGMNGCALQVNTFDNRHLIFMHDQDSEAIENGECRQRFINEQNFGNRFTEDDLIDSNRILCRVEPEHYTGPGDLYYNRSVEKVEKDTGKASYMAFYPFFIKVQGKWKLYMSLAGYAKALDGRAPTEAVKGEGVFLPGIHCVTSFEEK